MPFYFETGTPPQMLIPQALADGYLNIATGAQLKVMLCLLRFAGMPLDEEGIAKHCAIDVDEVKSAIKFWVDQKMLTRRGSTLCLQAPETVQQVKLPIYTGAEILELKERDGDFAQILEETQGILGKVLGHNDASILYGIYDYLGFNADLIMQLLGFCAGSGKTGFRYIERVAMDWHDRGIDTFEKAENYIRYVEQTASDEHKVAAMFGIEGRALSKKEKEYILAWREDMAFRFDMIEAAYNICVDNKGKLSFPYINGILKDWANRGVKTPEDIEKSKPTAPTDGWSEFEKEALGKLGEDVL